MIKGVQLSLMIGPAVPVPVPRDVLEALTSIRVTADAGSEQSGFELRFRLGKRSPLHTMFLISAGVGIQFMRVVIIATLNGTPHVLMDGMMTHHQVEPNGEGGDAVLSIQGKDLSVAMTYFDFSGVPYPAMPPSVRVLLVLAKYAWLGLIPMVIPAVVEDLPIPIERIPRHKGKDLDYIQLLAMESGYVFYMEPGPAPGTNVAYWGPEVRVGIPQPALSIDMDAHSNVEALSFRYDKERKELPIVFIQNKETKVPIPIPIPDVSPLNPPLGAIPPLPPILQPLTDTASLSPQQAIMRGLAYASEHSDVVFATGSLDVLRYGHVLKSRRLVGVRGAGHAFDGLYYVSSVTHEIKRGEYKQSFRLARNGLLPTVPMVPV